MQTTEKKPVFISRIPIRWGDMDAMRHVNNVTFFRYLEQARIEWYSHLGRGENAGIETVVVNCHCTYFLPLTYPGEIQVKTYAGSPGNSSFEIIQEISRTDEPDKLIARGGSKVVWVDVNTGRPIRLPDFMRSLMSDS